MKNCSELAKIDIKSAYRIDSIGSFWECYRKGVFFVDSVLPFGLRSTPIIFTAIVDALEWEVRQEGVMTLFHYLDDFLIATAPGCIQCQKDLHSLLTVFDRLHVPIA